MKKTRICELLDIEYPIIQAPMIWITSAELVAAVSNAGGLGTIGPNAGTTTISTDVDIVGQRLKEQIRKTRGLTNKPFAVNIAIGHGTSKQYSDRYADIVIEEQVPVAIVSQGSANIYIKDLHRAGIKVLHVVSTVDHAKKAEAAGVDAVVTSGFEGGGHSGWDALCTITLVPQVADAVKVPIIAGGGIADARGFVASLALGAEGAYMGTRFIGTEESRAHNNVKQALVEANDTSTISITHSADRQSFSASRTKPEIGGKAAEPEYQDSGTHYHSGLRRALKTKFYMECLSLLDSGTSPDALQAFANSPIPGEEGIPRGLAGLLQGDLANGIVSCGQAAGIIKEVLSVDKLIRGLMEEATTIIAKLQ
ncbi:NAD(P)H-dependent flavin oxidoreductase [Bacteroidota bacterium]